jgi:WG containing repeat
LEENSRAKRLIFDFILKIKSRGLMMKAVLLAVLLLFSCSAMSRENENLRLPLPEEVERVEISSTSMIQWYKAEELLKLLPKFVASEGTYLTKQAFQRGAFVLKNGKKINWMAAYNDSILLYEGSKEQLYVLPKKDEPLFGVWDDYGKEGYIDINGKIVIKPQFDAASAFSEGLAAVLIGEKWGYINRQGEIVIEPRWKQRKDWYGAVGGFNEGLAAVSEAAVWSVRDDSNYWTYKCGYINTKGEYVVQPQMRQSCLPFYEGVAIIEADFENEAEYEKGKGWVGYMKADGAWLIKPRFYTASYFYNGIARVSDETGEYYIDKTGKRVAKPLYDCQRRGLYFYEGLALSFSEKEKRYNGFINEKCELVVRLPLEIKADENSIFSEGLARVFTETGGKKLFGYIDQKGKAAIPFQFDEAHGFSENLAGVAIENKGSRVEGYINHKGEMVLKDTRDNAPFQNGLAFQYLYMWTISEQPDARNIYGYMNKQGKYVWLSPRAEVYLGKDWIRANYIGK